MKSFTKGLSVGECQAQIPALSPWCFPTCLGWSSTLLQFPSFWEANGQRLSSKNQWRWKVDGKINLALNCWPFYGTPVKLACSENGAFEGWGIGPTLTHKWITWDLVKEQIWIPCVCGGSWGSSFLQDSSRCWSCSSADHTLGKGNSYICGDVIKCYQFDSSGLTEFIFC